MPRPPKSVRDALKAAGNWDFQPSPPPFDPIEAFCASFDDTHPMPGAYDAVIDFSPPPPGIFENGPPFGDLPEMMEEILQRDLPGADILLEMGFEMDAVSCELLHSSYVAAAMQMANAHVGDELESNLALLCDEGVYLPGFLSTYVETLGEFCGTDDRVWRVSDFPSNVKALARAAHQASIGDTSDEIRTRFWLPCHGGDKRTAACIALSLCSFLREKNIVLSVEEMMSKVFSGHIPPAFYALSSQLSQAEFTSLALLFESFSTEGEFLRRFTSPLGTRALSILELEWPSPHDADLSFDIDVFKIVKTRLREWKTLSRQFSDAMGVSYRRVRFRKEGDPLQICAISPTPGGVTLASHYSPQRYQATFRACFGTPVVYTSVPFRSVSVGRSAFKAHAVSLIRNHLGVTHRR